MDYLRILTWLGAALAVDAGIFRNVGAMVLALLGIVLMLGSVQQRFATTAADLGNAGNNLISRIQPEGLWGQFAIGLVLGVVCCPCVGPTLGVAVVLASQGSHLPQVALLMGIFGSGAASPVAVLAYVSRSTMMKIRGKLIQVGKAGKAILGVLMIAVARLILSGVDKNFEAWLVDHSPAWLTALTTRF